MRRSKYLLLTARLSLESTVVLLAAFNLSTLMANRQVTERIIATSVMLALAEQNVCDSIICSWLQQFELTRIFTPIIISHIATLQKEHNTVKFMREKNE